MKIAEQVTFGGGGLDRRADLRGTADLQEMLAKKDEVVAIALWKGKPLFNFEDAPKLAELPVDADILSNANEAPVFLGAAGGKSFFAYDVSAWVPDEMPETLTDFFDPSEQVHPDYPDSFRFAELRAQMATLPALDAELAATARAILGWHLTHGYCSKCGAKTEVFMSGWQRKCPACSAMHFPRTDPVVIMLITHGNDVLIGRSPGWPEGMYSLLAGFVEPGETIEAAVRREVLEEAGIAVGEVGYLASQPWPYPSSLMIGCWGEARSREIVIDPHELEDAVWVSRERVFQSFSGEKNGLLPAREGAIAHFILQNWVAGKLE